MEDKMDIHERITLVIHISHNYLGNKIFEQVLYQLENYSVT